MDSPERGRRRDLDGIRGLAIALVVAYHLAPQWARGGFVGVDVFFVLSGYLITQILTADTRPGRVRRFYELRIRRLAPALAVVLAATLLAGHQLLLADELRELGGQVLAATLFVANFAFWLGSGYFDSAAIEKPLLHLWSLGVEEQFYLVWPALLWWLLRRPRRVLPATLALALLSFGATMVTVGSSPDAAFYLPWFRFWELLAGACCAQLAAPSVAFLRSRRAELAAWLGLALILAGACGIDPAAPFPSWTVLGPVLGTALLLRAAPATWLGRTVLSQPLVVGLGLVSYPLYLWHWPLLSLQEAVSPRAPLGQRAGTMALALLLAIATYRWVEIPARSAYRRWPRATVLTLSAVLAALAAAGAWVRARPTRPDLQVPAVTAFLQEELFRDATLRARFPLRPCLESGPLAEPLRPFCAASGPSTGAPTLVLWGDSTGESWAPLVRAIAAQRGAAAAVLSISGCPPLLGVRTPWHDGCELDDASWKLEFLQAARPSHIVLTARWGAYVNEPPTGFRGPSHLITTSPRDAPTLVASREAVAAALPATVARLVEIAPVVVIAAIPDLPLSPLRSLPRGLEFRTSRSAHDQAQRLVTEQLAALAAGEPRLRILDPAARLCATGTCEAVVDGNLLYTDQEHISAQGALTFQEELAALLARAGR